MPSVDSTPQQTTARAKILLLDKWTMNRQYMAHMLRVNSGFSVRAAAGVDELDGSAPDAALISTWSERVDTDEATRLAESVHRMWGNVPLAVLTDVNDARLAIQALQHGYSGYLLTSLHARLIVAAIRLIIAGGTFLPHTLIFSYLGLGGTPTETVFPPDAGMSQIRIAKPGVRLSGREIQVLTLVRQGKPNKIIAGDLQISESTVKVHVRHLMRKLRVTNRTQIAVGLDPRGA